MLTLDEEELATNPDVYFAFTFMPAVKSRSQQDSKCIDMLLIHCGIAINCLQFLSGFYIGQTGQALQIRMDTIRHHNSNQGQVILEYSNLPGHSITDFKLPF